MMTSSEIASQNASSKRQRANLWLCDWLGLFGALLAFFCASLALRASSALRASITALQDTNNHDLIATVQLKLDH